MLKSVLIVEDHESSNISVRKTMADLGISDISYAYYCDDALTQVRRKKATEDQFDLLITDLIFDDDGIPQQIKSGEELIIAVKDLQPSLKVLIFSAEHRASVIEQLHGHENIDGFVKKGRRDAEELKEAVTKIAAGRRHFPNSLRQKSKDTHTHEFTRLDIEIISLLANGVFQKDIPEHLAIKKFKPSSLSSVEKRLYMMKENLSLNKNEQLVIFCKVLGVI